MKMFLSALVAAGVGFAAAYFYVSNQTTALKAEHLKLQAQWQAEKEDLESALAAAKRKGVRVETIEKEGEPVFAPRRTAAQILENLFKIKPTGATRISAIRKIIHELEDLAELKNEAVPAIREFLTKNTDLDYSVETSDNDNNDRGRWTPPWSRRSAPTEFSLPPSLRIGLFDVLKEIGGEGAEQALAEVLSTTGRAVEVAYVSRMLNDMAPGKYSAMAVEAAKSLLRNPLAIDNPNRLDQSAESYLYGVLELFGDTSFAEDAKRLLVSDGNLDRNARDYLIKTQGEKAIPVLYDAYKNGAFSNLWDKASVATRILDYVGPNAEANNFLTEIVNNPDIDNRMKAGAIMRLAGMDFGRGDGEKVDPEVAKSRIPILVDLKSKLPEGDPLTRPVDITIVNLDHVAKGEPIENPWRDFGRGRSGRSDGNQNQNSAGTGSGAPPSGQTAK